MQRANAGFKRAAGSGGALARPAFNVLQHEGHAQRDGSVGDIRMGGIVHVRQSAGDSVRLADLGTFLPDMRSSFCKIASGSPMKSAERVGKANSVYFL